MGFLYKIHQVMNGENEVADELIESLDKMSKRGMSEQTAALIQLLSNPPGSWEGNEKPIQ